MKKIILLIFLIIALPIVYSITDVEYEAHIFSYFKMDETTGTNVEDSVDGGTRNASVGGSPSGQWQPAKLGNGFRTNGDEAWYIQLDEVYDSVIAEGVDFSVEFWMNVSDENAQYFFTKQEDVFNMDYSGYDNAWHVEAGSDVHSTDDDGGLCPDIVHNDWYHIVATWEAGVGLKMYQNGNYCNGNSQTTLRDTAERPAMISINYDTTQGLEGTIDNFIIHNKTLTPAEQNYSYNNGAGKEFFTGGGEEDSTPASIDITTYNLTDENCLAHRTGTNNECRTTSIIPSFEFSLSESGNCAIGTNNYNYTAMIANDADSNCTATAEAQDCTEPSTDALTQGELSQQICFGCRDTSGNENKTATGCVNVSTAWLQYGRVNSTTSDTGRANVNITVRYHYNKTLWDYTNTNSSGGWNFFLWNFCYDWDAGEEDNTTTGISGWDNICVP